MARLNRERFPDPNVPPPGTTAVTYGDGLEVADGSVLEVDFGTGHEQVMRGDTSVGGSSPTTTRGDMIRRGASADERLALGTLGRFLKAGATDPSWEQIAVADVTGAVATSRTIAGLDLSANRTAAEMMTALGLLWTPSLTSLSGWTDVSSGAGSVAVAGGALTGTIPGSTAPVNVAAATIPWAATDCFDVRARVQISGSTGADAKAHLRVMYSGAGFLIVADGAGGLALIRTLGLFASLATATGRPVDGTGWVRFRVVGQRMTLWYGTGIGAAEPGATDWTLLYDADDAALLAISGPTDLHVGGQNDSGGGLSGATDFVWRTILVRSL